MDKEEEEWVDVNTNGEDNWILLYSLKDPNDSNSNVENYLIK